THRPTTRPGTRRDVALAQKKRRTLWGWKARDPDPGQRVAWEGGRRDAAPLKRLIERWACWDVTVYGTERGATAASVMPPEQLGQSQTTTQAMVRHPCRQRPWVGRCKRKAIMVSKAKEMVALPIALFARCRVNGEVAELFPLDRIT